jgi:hypothetical protein
MTGTTGLAAFVLVVACVNRLAIRLGEFILFALRLKAGLNSRQGTG